MKKTWITVSLKCGINYKKILAISDNLNLFLGISCQVDTHFLEYDVTEEIRVNRELNANITLIETIRKWMSFVIVFE